jgi:hypothetical protein
VIFHREALSGKLELIRHGSLARCAAEAGEGSVFPSGREAPALID